MRPSVLLVLLLRLLAVARAFDYSNYDTNGDYFYPDDGIVTDCMHEYVSTEGKNGTFMSPRYPNPYPGQITCRYIFQGSGRERVQILFTDIDLNYPSGDPKEPHDCEEVDTVIVRVHIYDRPQDIGIYCGSKTPPMLMSNDNRMEVTFTSLSTTTAKGFRAIYRFVTDFGITSGHPHPDLVCGFIYESEKSTNGTFTSPNFPGLYPRETECHYLFYGKTNERVHITFPFFEVEGITPGCEEKTSSDYVEFSNFNVELIDRKMERSCGTEKDHFNLGTISSDGNFFRVTFKSNEIYDGRGFEAFYQFRNYEDPFSESGPHKQLNSSPGLHHPSGSALTLYCTQCLLLVYCIITRLILS